MGGPLWGVFALAAFAVLLVIYVRQLRRSGPSTLLAAGIVALLVTVAVVLLVVLQ